MSPASLPLSPADFLAAAIELAPPRDLTLVDCPPGTVCRVSARPIERGYRIMDVVTAANTEFLDQFRGDVSGYVSENAARCYKSAAPSVKHLVAGRPVANPCAKSHLGIELPGGAVEYLSPAFDPVTAVVNETVSWSAAVRTVWAQHAGRNAFILITPDFKRRLWPYARAGILGARTPVFVMNKAYNLDGQFHLDWPELLRRLDAVEEALNLGYSKASLQSSLLSAPNGTQEKVGAALLGERGQGEKPDAYRARTLTAGRVHSAVLERSLAPLRGPTEFTVAVMIAARTLSADDTAKAVEKKRADRAKQAADKPSKTASAAKDER